MEWNIPFSTFCVHLEQFLMREFKDDAILFGNVAIPFSTDHVSMFPARLAIRVKTILCNLSQSDFERQWGSI